MNKGRVLLVLTMIVLAWSGVAQAPAGAQPTPDVLRPTPPVLPKVQELPLPPPVELPAPAARPSDVPNRPLTAKEAALLALHYQPSVVVASAGVDGAQSRTRQVRSQLGPSVAVSPAYGASTGKGQSGAVPGVVSPGYQVSAVVRQLLFDFNQTRNLVREAVARERSATANLTRVQSDLVFEIKQAFYVYLQDVRLVAVNEATVRNQQYHLALAQARLNSGLGLPSDVVRAQTAVADAMFGLTTARTNASLAAVNLAAMIGVDPRTPITPAESDEPQPATMDVRQLVPQALQSRPEVSQAQAGVEAANYALKAARLGESPSLVGAMGWSQRGSGLPPEHGTLGAGLAVEWAPFDSGLTAGRVKEAEANLRSAVAQVEAARLTVQSDVSQAYLNLKNAEQKVTTADAEIGNAQEALRLARGRYEAGIGVFLDVLDTETALDTANSNRVNALAAVSQARAALAHAIGNMQP
jgi:outer membrane protein TolC